MSTTFLGGEGAGFRFRVQIDVVTTAIVHIYNHLGQVVAQWDDSFVAVDRLLQDAMSEGDYPSLEWGQRYKPFFLLRAQRELEERFLQDGEGGELQDVDDRVNDVDLEERAAHLDR